MRCPKCGYISFDNEEICSGCKKNIAKTSQELAGASYKTIVPDFLQFGAEEKEEEEDASSDEGEHEEGLDMGEDASTTEGEGFDAEDTVEFSTDADGDSGEAEEESKEIEFDLSGGGDVGEMGLDLSGGEELASQKDAGPSDAMDLQLESNAGGLDLSVEEAGDLEFSLDSDVGTELEVESQSPAAKASKPAPQKPAKKDKAADLDLSGMDLSGLMPEPAANKVEDFSIGELNLEEFEPAAGGKPGKSDGGAAAGGLPDLEFDGIDFNAATLPPAGSASGKKLRPAAKTGTALDNFDVDLGELVSGKPVTAKPAAAKPAAPAKKK